MLNRVLFNLLWPFSLGWSTESDRLKIPLPLFWAAPPPLAGVALKEETAS